MYCHLGTGFHECLGLQLSEETISEILKVMFQLKNLRRADGSVGRLLGAINSSDGGEVLFMDEAGKTACWPSSLTLVVSASCRHAHDYLTFWLIYSMPLDFEVSDLTLAEAVSAACLELRIVIYYAICTAKYSHNETLQVQADSVPNYSQASHVSQGREHAGKHPDDQLPV